MSVAEIDIRRPAKLLIGQHPRPGKDLTRRGDRDDAVRVCSHR